MTTRGWRQSVIDYIRIEAQPEDEFGHQPRVYALATQIADGMGYDDDILFAAAWMHDLGVFTGHRPKDPAATFCMESRSIHHLSQPGTFADVGISGGEVGWR